MSTESEVKELAAELESRFKFFTTFDQIYPIARFILDREATKDAKLLTCWAQVAGLQEAMKIIYADIRALKIEWFKEKGYDTCIMVIENIRKQSAKVYDSPPPRKDRV